MNSVRKKMHKILQMFGYTSNLLGARCTICVSQNEKNDLIPIRNVTGLRICIDCRKIDTVIRNDHYPFGGNINEDKFQIHKR